MPYTSVWIDLCFLSAAIGIWLFLLFNVLLTFFAFLNGISSEKEQKRLLQEPFPFPFMGETLHRILQIPDPGVPVVHG